MLKQNIKNDYTFEKTVSRFLGEVEIEGSMISAERTGKISQFYRKVMPDIIKHNMRN